MQDEGVTLCINTRAEMLREEVDGQRQRAVGLRLGIGLTAVAREGVVGARGFVDGYQWVGSKTALSAKGPTGIEAVVDSEHYVETVYD